MLKFTEIFMVFLKKALRSPGQDKFKPDFPVLQGSVKGLTTVQIIAWSVLG